jgi:hypothetical protein
MMSEAKYILVTFNFYERPVPNERLKELFSKARDWVRYAPNCYILYTTTDIGEWATRIRKRVDERDSIYLVEFDPDVATGYLPERVWTWLGKERA